MVVTSDWLVRTPLAADIAEMGIEFHGPPELIDDTGLRRECRIWFRLVDHRGHTVTPRGKARVRFTLNNNYFGYLSCIAEDEIYRAIEEANTRRRETDGERIYVLDYPRTVVLTPEWDVRYELEIWFRASERNETLYRTATGILDPRG